MAVTPAGLTYTTAPIATTHDGQIIENLDIWVESGVPITVNHDNVVIRNVIVHHANGNAIEADDVRNLTISDSQIINTSPPTGSGGEQQETTGINAVDVTGLRIDHVRLENSEVGIYVGNSPGAQLSFIEGYNMQGPYPAGQLVQFFNSPNSSLTDFYNYNDPNKSHPEDNISVINSANVTIARGVIDGNNSPSGAGVMFEGNSEGGRVTDVTTIHMGNGAFSSYSNDVTFTNVRSFDNIDASQGGRGESLSNALIFNSAGENVTYVNATYTNPGNPQNIAWDESGDSMQITEARGATPGPHIQNVFDWTETGDASAIYVSSTTGAPVGGAPAQPAPTTPAAPATPELPSTPGVPSTPSVPSAPAAPQPRPPASTTGSDLNGNSRANTLTGTSAGEKIDGGGGNDKLFGLAGNDSIWGGTGSDRIDGGAGTDHIWGGRGSDTFVFKAGNGVDWIEDFAARGREQDRIEVDNDLFANFKALMAAAKNVDGNVVIQIGADQLVLEGVHTSHLSSGDFLFV
ncbi:hemolysin [Enterovirga sp. DB1703]|uniref:Hemolysin n=2 Tax=Enterovirga aerilata TaxID=2730920 RepID=A0A849I2Z1_9HYPH|nr:hemolysin [Enterovirga sp. DB1703]NNM72004.1 hemolysin [Enterovirga sp. DB1703]